MNFLANKKAILVFLSITFLASVLIYITRDRSFEQIKRNEVIRIGYAVEPPYAMVDKNGDVTGESPEIAKRICAELGIKKIEWFQTDFNSLIPQLISGRFDVIAAGMFITKERSEKINFSEPTFHVKQALLVLEGNPKKLFSYQIGSMNNIKYAVIKGSIEEMILLKNGVFEEQLIRVPDAVSGKAALESGLVDGVALSQPAITQMAAAIGLGKAEIVKNFEQPPIDSGEKVGYGAFGFRTNDVELLDSWNAVLNKFIGSNQHLKILNAFGLTKDELPGNISKKEIILKNENK